jgi:hypothetical protein
VAIAITVLYGLLAFIAVTNLLFMRRAKTGDGPDICVLIPARNEAENLKGLLPELMAQGRELGGTFKLYLFDDESDDGTGEIAASLGATVIRPREPLPKGWTGKNRACDALARAAAEDSSAEWWLFLDADISPKPGFLSAMRHMAKNEGHRVGMITGFPHMLPGAGIEPLFLAWVGWILLAFNPFGIVRLTGVGHNQFKNGQVHLWRASVYTRIWPNERVKGKIMEDVSIGRLLAKEGVAVETVNLSKFLAVRMYKTWRKTLDGMSKNSFEITGTTGGTIGLALLFFALAWLWLAAGALWPIAGGLFLLSGLAVAAIVRMPLWVPLPMPVICMIGGYTMLRSLVWKRTGQTRWKGRTYS